MKLICMRGYSGSGKSTRAREIAANTGAIIVSRDELRKTLTGQHWPTAGEEWVSRAEGNRVVELLRSKRSVIVDHTHLNPDHLRDWAKVAALLGAEFEVVEVVTPVEVCVARDRERIRRGGRGVGEAEIRRQASVYA